MQTLERVKHLLVTSLQIDNSADQITPQTRLLEEVAEFDSMAVMIVVAALEEEFDIAFEDEEITAENFETLETLATFVRSKQPQPVEPEI